MTPGIKVANVTDITITSYSLVEIITSQEDHVRNISLHKYCTDASISTSQLLQHCEELDKFVRYSTNLYEKVRALFFLYSIHRFHLQDLPSIIISDNDSDDGDSDIPYEGHVQLLDRNFDKAIDIFLVEHRKYPSRAISSALAKAYYNLGFQTLANQVKSSVKNHSGNEWMFQVNNIKDYPKKICPELLPNDTNGSAKVLFEQTPVRMDLSHCGWSDIFFLGMDFPEGARVLNISVDLAVKGRHKLPAPPIETYLEVTNEPTLKITSIDLNCSATLTHISEVFDFGKDYLGLLKAGIVAGGLIPPGLEGSSAKLGVLFSRLIGRGLGLHLTTKVREIPKGSRLAVSTNLLGSIISLCMRATGQTSNITGQLKQEERRLVAARAILGEWLGGSGGGWQDSGGIWPGIKLIEGVRPKECDPEYGLSRGCLLPQHRQLTNVEAPPSLIKSLQDCLILVHGGMAQNVGPILEMVTEKYLLRDTAEWEARFESLRIFNEILECLASNNIQKLAKLTTRNFYHPLQKIVPWASNKYTETLIERTVERFGDGFLGFWMLGGMSGGGMGFIFKPEIKAKALDGIQEIMLKTKQEMSSALPFSMDPVVYEFSINDKGTVAQLCQESPSIKETTHSTPKASKDLYDKSLQQILDELGFDRKEHERVRVQYKEGIISLKQNRLPLKTKLTNISPHDVIFPEKSATADTMACGLSELKKGTVGVVTLAAGVGSRWSQGAGCVKALHPFCKLDGKHRSFLEVHLAKSRKISNKVGTHLPHVFTTSYMTNDPLTRYLETVKNHDYKGPLYQSLGKAVGLRLIPTIRDLKFAWKEKQQQKLDQQAQKMVESGQNALIAWAKACGEASDYKDNLPLQCLHPVGHYHEIPNLILNGTLCEMLNDRPQLKYLMLHNIDTVGADVDPTLLGLFVQSASTLSFEVIPREIDDIGGGLARVNDKVRLVEGLALPCEKDEFKFSYYNSMTTWLDIDKLLTIFSLSRKDLSNNEKVARSLHEFSKQLPTYVALKDVKNRWGNGQEDIFPTAQFEKLWSDVSSLENIDCDFVVVPRVRGAQLKEQAQLDGWLRDGSAAYLDSICEFDSNSGFKRKRYCCGVGKVQ